MDETKEWIYLLLPTVYYLTLEILLEFPCYFLACLPVHTQRVCRACVFLTYQFLVLRTIPYSNVKVLPKTCISFRRISSNRLPSSFDKLRTSAAKAGAMVRQSIRTGASKSTPLEVAPALAPLEAPLSQADRLAILPLTGQASNGVNPPKIKHLSQERPVRARFTSLWTDVL